MPQDPLSRELHRGTDVRDIRRWLNAMHSEVMRLTKEINHLKGMAPSRGMCPPPTRAGVNSRRFGIEFRADRIRVHARRAVLWRYGDTPLVWSASQTDLLHTGLEDEGVTSAGQDLDIVLHFDPDVGGSGTIQFYDDDEEAENDIQARLYTIHAKELLDEEEQPFDPKQYSVTLERIWRPGDVDIVPLFGDHPVEEEVPEE